MEGEKTNCLRCKHYYVTWDQYAPRGCHGHGFKTKEIPSTVVKKTSGMDCLLFIEKPKPKKPGQDLNSDDLW